MVCADARSRLSSGSRTWHRNRRRSRRLGPRHDALVTHGPLWLFKRRHRLSRRVSRDHGPGARIYRRARHLLLRSGMRLSLRTRSTALRATQGTRRHAHVARTWTRREPRVGRDSQLADDCLVHAESREAICVMSRDALDRVLTIALAVLTTANALWMLASP